MAQSSGGKVWRECGPLSPDHQHFAFLPACPEATGHLLAASQKGIEEPSPCIVSFKGIYPSFPRDPLVHSRQRAESLDGRRRRKPKKKHTSLFGTGYDLVLILLEGKFLQQVMTFKQRQVQCFSSFPKPLLPSEQRALRPRPPLPRPRGARAAPARRWRESRGSWPRGRVEASKLGKRRATHQYLDLQFT